MGTERHGPAATTLAALIQAIVAPYTDKDHPSIAMAGPEVPVSGHAVMDIALLLHEFATNAAKYGALSSRNGRIDIHWSVSNGTLTLVWRERGGPPIEKQPETEGFGSLLSHLTAGPLACKITRDWDREGLTATLSIPLERLARPN